MIEHSQTPKARLSRFLALCAALLAFAEAEPPIDAAALLEIYSERLIVEAESEDSRLIAVELDRIRTERSPQLRLRQSSAWAFDGSPTVGLGLAATLPVIDPEAAAREQLAHQRLALSQQNGADDRDRRMYEFHRTLRLLAHVEEVAAVLDEQRVQLLAIRPDWQTLGATAVAAPLDEPELAYLELVQALERARGERGLLLEMVSGSVGSEIERLTAGTIGRPPMPSVAGPGASFDCSAASAEARRARQVRRIDATGRSVEASRYLTQVTLDLAADVNYSAASSARDKVRSQVRLSLRVAMPASGSVSSALSVEVTPTDARQELTVRWPISTMARQGGTADTSSAELQYQQAMQSARLAASRAVAAYADASNRVELRRQVLRSELAAATVAAAGPARLNSLLQARMALLNAELERDLASLALAETCGSDQ